MAAPKLDISLRQARKLLDDLRATHSEVKNLQPKLQRFVAEILFLRAHDIFIETVADIAYRLVAGSVYMNGSTPSLIVGSSSIAASRGVLLTSGRTVPRQNLKWAKAKEIKDSVAPAIQTQEPYIQAVDAYSANIADFTYVRNVIAHRNSQSRKNFKTVLRKYYGANCKISAGAFLLTERKWTRCKLLDFTSQMKVVLQELCKG